MKKYNKNGTISVVIKNKKRYYYLHDDMMVKILTIGNSDAIKYFKKIKIKDGEHVKYRTQNYTGTRYYGGGDDDNASRYTATAYFMVCKITGLEIRLD